MIGWEWGWRARWTAAPLNLHGNLLASYKPMRPQIQLVQMARQLPHGLVRTLWTVAPPPISPLASIAMLCGSSLVPSPSTSPALARIACSFRGGRFGCGPRGTCTWNVMQVSIVIAYLITFLPHYKLYYNNNYIHSMPKFHVAPSQTSRPIPVRILQANHGNCLSRERD